MERIGTYNGRSAYGVTRNEFIQKEYYNSTSTYYAIVDDCEYINGYKWKKFIFQNRLIGLLNDGNNILEDNPSGKGELYYIKKQKIEEKPIQMPKNSFIDVDEFLRSAHSVDEYLKEMSEVDYACDS